MIEEVLFVHHSHTDIGYTHPQPVVMELHRRFIDEALDHADATVDWPEASRFRWTCEVAGITRDWWERADEGRRRRFRDAVQRGQFEVAGLAWHMTPLMDHAMALDVLEHIAFFRGEGIPIRSAMNTDVNGLPWGMVDALLDHGIEHLSMAVNEIFGHALRPWPSGFRWQAPSGRTLLAYNGLIYGIPVDVHNPIPFDIDRAETTLPAYLKLWEGRGYPHRFLMLQATNVTLHDNAPPNPQLCRFVRTWNERDNGLRLRLVTLSDFFDRLAATPDEHTPILRGDWTDWWNFGCGSTAAETAMALAGQRALREALALRPWPSHRASPSDDEHIGRARRAATLYAEHSWGSDRAVTRPLSLEARMHGLLKLALAPESLSLARMLRRDGLEALARHAGGDETTALLWNPHPFPLRAVLPIPSPSFGSRQGVIPDGTWTEGDLEFVTRPQSHIPHRQDVVVGNLKDEALRWIGPIDLPPLGYRTLPYARAEAAEGELTVGRDEIGNERLRVRFSAAGGIASLTLDGIDYAGTCRDGWRLAQPVLERPAGNRRDEIFGPLELASPDWHTFWHPDWEAERSGPSEVLTATGRRGEGCAEFRQTMRLPSGDTVTNLYRLLPGEPSLELTVDVHKLPSTDPHALYLPLPLELGRAGAPRCHFETAGAVVELDREQLPGSSRHFITTQRWIRLQGERELTVASPDTPLWQVGGFTFGRLGDGGAVARPESALVAWLTNNYWITNFRADQRGLLRFRFRLLPAPARPLERSIEAALPHVHPPRLHLYREHGPVRHDRASLFDIDLRGALLSGLDALPDGARLTLLNPSDAPVTISIGPGVLTPTAAWHTSLAGERGTAAACDGGVVRSTLAPRTWTALEIACTSRSPVNPPAPHSQHEVRSPR